MNKKVLIFVVIIFVLVMSFCLIFFSEKRNKNRDYELLTVKDYIYYPLEVEGKYGVIKNNGEIIINPEFDEVQIPNQDKAIFVLKSGDSYKVRDDNNNDIFTNFDMVVAIEGVSSTGEKIYNNTVLKYKKNNKYGILDFSGKKVTDPIYDEVTSLTDKYGEILIKTDGKYGVINVKGVVLVNPKYDYVKGDGYCINNSYKEGGYIVGKKTDKGLVYGYINKDGKEVIKLEQETLYRVTEINSNDVYMVASLNGRYAIYKNNDNLTDYKYINVFYNNGTDTFTVQKNKMYGLVNLDGKVVIKEQYDELMAVGIYVKASKDDVSYTFDLNGKEVANSQFVSLSVTSTGKFYISMDDNYRYGIVDKEKKVIVENKYDYIEEVENTSLLIATIGTDITIYSGSAKEIVSVERAELEFIGDYIKVDTADESYYLTIDGKKVDNKTVYIENPIYAQKSGGKWGFVDIKNNVIVDYKYDEVTEINKYGFAGVKKDGKWGIINKNGEIILEPTYESNEIKPVFIGKYCLKNGVVRDFI